MWYDERNEKVSTNIYKLSIRFQIRAKEEVMLKAYIENEKTLIYTDTEGFRLQAPTAGFALSLLRADIGALCAYVDNILDNCEKNPEQVPSQKEIVRSLTAGVDAAHPLFRYFYPINESTLRRCFHKRLRQMCIKRPVIIDRSEFRELYNRIPFPLDHAYLEEYYAKLQYARIKKHYAKGSQEEQQLQIEATYLSEKTRSLDKFMSENPDFPEDVLEVLGDFADNLRENVRAVFDVEYEPMNLLPTEKRHFLNNLMHQKQSVFQSNDYSISHSITVGGVLAERFKKAGCAEDYVHILKDCPLNRVEELPVYSFDEALEVEQRAMLQSGMHLKKCRNCEQYFVPVSRADEIYCSVAFAEGKTCRQMGYGVKQNADTLLKAYRTAYKTQHAKMQRNRTRSGYREDVFLPWVDSAKKEMRRAQQGEISDEEFLMWLGAKRKESV